MFVEKRFELVENYTNQYIYQMTNNFDQYLQKITNSHIFIILSRIIDYSIS
jgi:hypothetical protein